jgi:tRNA A37 threonylcarbamoyladenosine synthetase subunit TsaC/SUA5/YrdC
VDAAIDGSPVSGDPPSIVTLIGDIPEITRRGAGDVSLFE